MLDLFEIGSLCLGTAALFGFRSYHVNRKAEYFKSATRVNDLKGLSELLENKTEPLLVAVSGTVGSDEPFKCEHIGVFGVFLEENAKLVFEMWNVNNRVVTSAAEFLLQHKEVPWFLEDSTDRVHVVGAQYAKGFYYNLKDFVFYEPASELVKKIVKPEDFIKMLEHTCFGRVLELGKPLTIVGEAVRYSNGSLLIRTPTNGSFMIFDGYGSLDKMISSLESYSQVLLHISVGLTAVATLAFASYAIMPSIKKAWFLDKSDNTAGQKAKAKEKPKSKYYHNLSVMLAAMGTVLVVHIVLQKK